MLRIDRIKELCSELPKKDKELAIQFINTRDLSSLRDLVRSLDTKIKKNLNSDHPSEEYENIESQVEELMYEIDFYIMDIYEDDTIKEMFDSEEY